MRSDGFSFLSGGLGAGPCFVPTLEMISRTFAQDRARSRFARCAVPVGLACIGAVSWHCHRALPWGLGVGALCSMRWAVEIGGGRGVTDALSRCDWRVGCRVGSAVQKGLVGRLLCGWRCAIGIGGEGVVWVALCREDWWGGHRVGSAVQLSLAGMAYVWVALCRWECVA